MKLKIVSWNMAYWNHKQLHNEAWDYLLNSTDADFFLVQETKRPESLANDKNFIWHNSGATSGRKNWGTGIYSKRHKLSQEPENSILSWNKQTFDEMCVIANTTLEDNKI